MLYAQARVSATMMPFASVITRSEDLLVRCDALVHGVWFQNRESAMAMGYVESMPRACATAASWGHRATLHVINHPSYKLSADRQRPWPASQPASLELCDLNGRVARR